MKMSEQQMKSLDKLYEFLKNHPEAYEEAINSYLKEHNFSNAEGIGDSAPFTINFKIDNNPTYIHLTADVILNEYMKQKEYADSDIRNGIKIRKVIVSTNDTLPFCKSINEGE